jgi:alkylation response protein AidB-like acyl-CoA dehydrogenase
MSAALDDTDRAESIRMIRDSAAAVAPPGGDLKRVRALRFTDPGYDRGTLRQMGEMGWIGLRVPEERGGAGLGMGEACALAEALGTSLVPEPFIPCALSAGLLAALGGAGPLDALLAGEAVVLTAWQERADTLDALGTADAPRRFVPIS